MKAPYRNIDDLQPACSPHEIIAHYSGALYASVHPSLGIRIGNVESCDSYSKDLVGGFRNISLDSFLVGIAQDRGHDELTYARYGTVRKGGVEG